MLLTQKSVSRFSVLLAAGLLLGCATPVSAGGRFLTQMEEIGSLSGTVRDERGNPVAGAGVLVKGGCLHQPRNLQTNGQGQWRAPMLQAGQYEITFSKNGFIGTRLVVSMNVGENAAHDVVMRTIQTAAAVVEVVASAASVCDKCEVRTASNYGSPEQRIRRASAPPNTESYNPIQDNPFKSVRQDPLSTFSVDVDTASYGNIRRFLTQGQLPPSDAVRIEEMLNYFTYQHPEPRSGDPFGVSHEVFPCPWQPKHQLLRVALQAKRLQAADVPPRNLVFLIDVSGSMSDDNKLPLLKQGLQRLCKTLREEDRVALVVYAGSSGVVLEPTSGKDKATIIEALERLEAGGSTHGAEGIELAYEVAKKHFRQDADNRVLLCTDGDFNVGVSDEGGLVRLIEEKRKSGVFLTCLGFGMGNYKDANLEQLADKGNGNYAYIDYLAEMDKVFGVGGAGLVTLAKDVKLQLEFNPAKIQGYRLIGYENRLLNAEDFNDDAKDAGEMNAGHSVTALYELIPAGVKAELPGVDALKYQTPSRLLKAAPPELLTIKVRYKKPRGIFSRKLEYPVQGQLAKFEDASEDSRWAAAVATFGMALRESAHKGSASLDLAFELGKGALGKDKEGYRAEMLGLVGKARQLAGK